MTRVATHAPDWRAVAIHEAGHVVEAMLCGARLEWVSLDEDAGRCAAHLRDLDPIDHCAFGFSGCAAEEAFGWSPSKPEGADARIIAEALARVPERDRIEVRRRAHLLAQRIAQARRADIERVARALLIHRRLEAADVRRLVTA